MDLLEKEIIPNHPETGGQITLSKHKATGDCWLELNASFDRDQETNTGAVRPWVDVVNSVAAVTLNYKLQQAELGLEKF